MPTHTQIFLFWKSIEAITPQDAAKVDANSQMTPVYSLHNGCPWSPGHAHQAGHRLRHRQTWRYTVQGGIYDANALLEKLTPPQDEHGRALVVEERGGNKASRLFEFVVDDQGYPVEDSLMLSMAGWAAGVILTQPCGFHLEGATAPVRDLPPLPEGMLRTQSGYAAFDDVQDHLTLLFNEEVRRAREDRQPLRPEGVDALTQMVVKRCSLVDYVMPQDHRIACSSTSKSKADTDKSSASGASKSIGEPDTLPDSLINSFYIESLRGMSRGALSKPLLHFLDAVGDRSRPRIDVKSERGSAMLELLMQPKMFPKGRWPSQHPLVFSQQAALNAQRDLFAREDSVHAPSLFAVNGPPGTGKTTLLKDVIAAALVDRAEILCRYLHPQDIFGEKHSVQIGKYTHHYRDLKADLVGTTIIAASSNNGAVENISMELPSMLDRDRPDHLSMDYFADLAQVVTGKEDAWAMLSAKLGKKSNRGEFLGTFWFGEQTVEADGPLPPAPAMGMRKWLKALQAGEAIPIRSWADARAAFTSALSDEKKLRDDYQELSGLLKQIQKEQAIIQSAHEALAAADLQQAQVVTKHQEALAKMQRCKSQCNAAEKHENQMLAMRPGFLETLFSFGKAIKGWRTELNAAHNTRLRYSKALDASVSQTESDDATRKKGKADLERSQLKLSWLKASLAKLQAQHAGAESYFGKHWPDMTLSEEQRELSAFWCHPDWQQVQMRVFMAALDLHRALIENAPDHFQKNLSLSVEWLKGKCPGHLAQLSMDSLALVVPVFSTTFAAATRMLADIPMEGIGLLLIDEAGQACPQHAAGALQRSRKAIVVGDPLQLEPVVTIPTVIEAAIAQVYGVDKPWWPSLTSTQALSDQANPMGTCLTGQGFSTGCPDGKIWVGSPLRVHRRCDEPMFSISNLTTYDGLMVQGKSNTSSDDLPPSQWLDVAGTTATGHWIAEEGEKLDSFMRTLIQDHSVDPKNIFMISPFRQVVMQLKTVGRRYQLDVQNHVGTIHTTQGKESDVVFLVLGGNPSNPGAKDWAAEKPNLLNVAASRAKRRLYIIGDKAEWRKRPYFSTATQLLDRHSQR